MCTNHQTGRNAKPWTQAPPGAGPSDRRCWEPVALAVPGDRWEPGRTPRAAQKTQVEAADSFIALRKGGQRLRNLGGAVLAPLPSQLLGCAGWRCLCGWRPVGEAGSGHLPGSLCPPPCVPRAQVRLHSQERTAPCSTAQVPRALPAHGPARSPCANPAVLLFFRIMCRMLLRVAHAC